MAREWKREREGGRQKEKETESKVAGEAKERQEGDWGKRRLRYGEDRRAEGRRSDGDTGSRCGKLASLLTECCCAHVATVTGVSCDATTWRALPQPEWLEWFRASDT